MKKVIVLGASPNAARYSHMAAERLSKAGHHVFAVGKRTGKIGDVNISAEWPKDQNIDLITLYLNSKNQEGYYSQILQTLPKRLIFNPGAENPVLQKLAEEQGIQTENACTLVLLSQGLI